MWKKLCICFSIVFIFSCKDKTTPQPNNELTTLEGRVLNIDNNSPVGNIGLNLIGLYKDNQRFVSNRFFSTNAKGEYSIDFKAAADSAYAIEIANAPTWYQDTYPYNSPNSTTNNNFQRHTKQTKDIWVCGAGFIQISAIDSNKIQCDTIEVQSIYRNCSLEPNYRYEVKVPKLALKDIEPFQMPSPQKPVMLWKAYKNGRIVFEKRDTVTLLKQGETLNYKIVF